MCFSTTASLNEPSRRLVHRQRSAWEPRTGRNWKQILILDISYFGHQHENTRARQDSTEKRKRHSCAAVLHIIGTGQSQHTANFQMITFLFPARSKTTVLMSTLTLSSIVPLGGRRGPTFRKWRSKRERNNNNNNKKKPKEKQKRYNRNKTMV